MTSTLVLNIVKDFQSEEHILINFDRSNTMLYYTHNVYDYFKFLNISQNQKIICENVYQYWILSLLNVLQQNYDNNNVTIYLQSHYNKNISSTNAESLKLEIFSLYTDTLNDIEITIYDKYIYYDIDNEGDFSVYEQSSIILLRSREDVITESKNIINMLKCNKHIKYYIVENNVSLNFLMPKNIKQIPNITFMLEPSKRLPEAPNYNIYIQNNELIVLNTLNGDNYYFNV